MQVGRLNKRITLQYPTRVRDAMGGYVDTWEDAATVWAGKWSVSSIEMKSGLQVSMVRIQKFMIRFRHKLLPSWRIKYGNEYYNITSIDPDEKNEFMFLMAQEVT